jgi:hypothetical protein
MSAPHSASSNRALLHRNSVGPSNNNDTGHVNGSYMRDPTTISTNDIGFPKLLEQNDDVGEQTLYQVEITNEDLFRKSNRSELANKSKFLTKRWQTALVATVIILALAGGIGK